MQMLITQTYKLTDKLSSQGFQMCNTPRPDDFTQDRQTCSCSSLPQMQTQKIQVNHGYDPQIESFSPVISLYQG